MKKRPLTLAIVPGAEDGVGPLLLLKALLPYRNVLDLNFIWCGDAASLQIASKNAGIDVSFSKTSLAVTLDGGPSMSIAQDFFATATLKRQAQFLEHGVSLAMHHRVDALVTGPVDKACLEFLDGGNYRGQTEYLSAHLAKGKHKPMMVFMGAPFLLSLLTVHVPLKDVSNHITKDFLIDHLSSITAYASAIRQKPKEEIKVAILGLNPHAGEDGLLGKEEQQLFLPAIAHMKERGYKLSGPLAADGFFAYCHLRPKDDVPDVIVAAYHDQGLIPYKLLTKGAAVNVTLGLSVPRVSPAHGTAYALRKNLACPKSTEMAIKTAISLATLSLYRPLE
jgi:4-hydroxythreonine-4-phosphate dehydrogenase